MSEENQFSGFMPMIGQVHLTQEMPMIDTEGGLVTAHTLTLTSKDGKEFVFSISNHDLMRLSFLIHKVISMD
jgi:hypothetical protein